MNNQLYFNLHLIPDLTLNKYAVLGENGVNGVLDRHNSFLRLWHHITLLLNASMHLYITYDPSLPNGNKFKIGILIDFKGKIYNADKIYKILNSSSISDFYKFEKPSQLNSRDYLYKMILYKKERFLVPIKSSTSPESFYVVPAWKTNENGRLYDMFRMMEALNVYSTYRVDLYPKELSETMQSVFMKPLTWLREKTNMRVSQNISLTGDKVMSPKDPNAEETLNQYENFLKSLDTSPHFYVNINCFSESEIDCRMILDSAASEAIQMGEYQLKIFKGNFDAISDIGIDAIDCYSINKPVPKSLCSLAITFALEDVCPFFRFPALYDGESIEMPKETNPILNSEGIKLGLDDAGYDVRLPIELLPKHAFISGVPGSGKTNTMLHIAYELWNTYKIPFLVLEPAKQEYRVLATANIPELLIFSPSSKTRFPLMINPFEFPRGITLSEHIRQLMQVFEGTFILYPPLPFLLDKAIENIYRKHKWIPQKVNDGTLEYPTMGELFQQLKDEIEEANYQGESRDNMKAALEMRIGSLLQREMGDVFNVKKSSLSPENWLTVPAIIELETMGSDPANFTTLLLCTLIRETLKSNCSFAQEKPVRHVIFIEEAHNLIGQQNNVSSEVTNPKVAATAFIVKMLAEVRALKEGIIIADQLPTVMPPEVLKNTGLKIAQKITAADDRQVLGFTMSATALQMEQMASFLPGHALITFEGVIKPFGVQIQFFVGKKVDENPPDDTALFELMSRHTAFKMLLIHSVSIIWENYYKQKEKDETRALDILKLIMDKIIELQRMISIKEKFNSQESKYEIKKYVENEIKGLRNKYNITQNIVNRMIEMLSKFRERVSDIGLYPMIESDYKNCRQDITFINSKNKQLKEQVNVLSKQIQNHNLK